MDRALNLPAFSDLLIRRGLNQSQLADRLGVSREAVSKWFSGESFPQPEKLIRIGMVLEASFDQLVLPQSEQVPVVYYRKKSSRKTKPENLAIARERADLLRRLAPSLPRQRLTRPPTLQEPTNDYDYVQRVASDVRREMKFANKHCLDFSDLIAKFGQLNATIIPVLWGDQIEHGNALNVYLPDSATTWVFLNLDSNAIDFMFWMAHELGHSLAPEMGEETGEPFADAFAQALLFSGMDAAALRPELERIPGVGRRITRIKNEAKSRTISPLTIRYALHAYEDHARMPRTGLGELPAFMGSVVNFGKGYRTMSQALFDGKPPTPAEYAAVSTRVFKTPFFEALSAFCKREADAEHFINRVLGLPLADAKALSGELSA